jgi:NADPH:quinone reductase-like Zn-dependent oxidoreductase
MLSAVMKAILLRELGGPERLVLDQVADPEPGPGEAVVALRAAALNHRDAWIRKGLYAGIRLPVILGSDGAGEVAAVGAGVDPAWLGRHVVINPSLDWGADPRVQGPAYRILGLPDDGTYAERVKVPAENLFAKPAALSWESAAAIPLAGLTAYRALVTRARVQRGETVLVTGIGGGVATCALLIARHLGARVLVTSGSDAKLARARHLGADGGVNYRQEGWAKQVQALCEGGPDVIVDSAGRDVLPALLDIVRPGGRIVTFGATTGSPSTVEVRRIFWKQIAILGSTMGTPEEFSEMLALFDGPLTPVVDRVFPLLGAPDAHRRMDQADQFGKLVLEIS